MSELINRWFSRTPQVSGVAACGLRYPEGSAFSRSWDPQISDTTLNELWSRLIPIVEVAGGTGAEKLHWTFDVGLITATTHPTGPIFFLLLNSKAGERDAAGVERLLVEFRALRG